VRRASGKVNTVDAQSANFESQNSSKNTQLLVNCQMHGEKYTRSAVASKVSVLLWWAFARETFAVTR